MPLTLGCRAPRDPGQRLYSARAVLHTAADVRPGGPERQSLRHADHSVRYQILGEQASLCDPLESRLLLPLRQRALLPPSSVGCPHTSRMVIVGASEARCGREQGRPRLPLHGPGAHAAPPAAPQDTCLDTRAERRFTAVALAHEPGAFSCGRRAL